MEVTRVHIIFLLTFITLPSVRSVTCLWSDSFEFEGKCFQYDSTKLNYSEARDACLSIGGVLAAVKSKAQIEDAAKHIPPYRTIWIGANDIAVEGAWVWEEGDAPVTELSGIWESDLGEPSNRTDEDCGAISTYPAFNGVFDAYCYETFGFLCMETALDPAASAITTSDPANTETAASTTGNSATTKTAVSSTETSATTNTAASITETSATTKTAAPTTGTSANTNTSASTTESSATTNAAASTSNTSATTLTTSIQPMTSTTLLTATTVTTTTNTTTNAVFASTSTAKVPTTSVKKKNGANFIDFNVLLLLSLYAFNYLTNLK